MTPDAFTAVTVRAADQNDLAAIAALMRPFVARGELLSRSRQKMIELLADAFLVEAQRRAVGFAALETYSKKLSELQCLAVEETPRATEAVQAVVRACVDRARERGVLEVMAVVPDAFELPLIACGFGLSLPQQKRALFIKPDRSRAQEEAPADTSEVTIRPASGDDLAAVVEFLAPFVTRGNLLPRSPKQLAELLNHAFVAEGAGRIAGFAALELYSAKLAEIQCLTVDAAYQGCGVGRQLVARCVACAREHHVAETMAITSQEGFLLACGFDYCLADPKTALFLRTR